MILKGSTARHARYLSNQNYSISQSNKQQQNFTFSNERKAILASPLDKSYLNEDANISEKNQYARNGSNFSSQRRSKKQRGSMPAPPKPNQLTIPNQLQQQSDYQNSEERKNMQSLQPKKKQSLLQMLTSTLSSQSKNQNKKSSTNNLIRRKQQHRPRIATSLHQNINIRNQKSTSSGKNSSSPHSRMNNS